MMKCDMCYDRTSVGKKPMCATVCPSQALFFGTREQIEQLRPLSAPVNTFQFGQQTITTQVYMMVPRKLATRGAARRCHRGDGRAAAEPRGVVEGGERAWPAGAGRERSVCRGRGVAMADVRPDPRRSDRSRDQLAGARRAHRNGAREPLCACARARADHDRAGLRARRRPARLAAGFPDRLAAGSLRRAPGLHEVPGADQRRVHAGTGLDRRPELVPEAQRPAGDAADRVRRRSRRRRGASSSPTRTNTNPACWCG